jgi:polyhydroxybutyrate depolymerase
MQRGSVTEELVPLALAVALAVLSCGTATESDKPDARATGGSAGSGGTAVTGSGGGGSSVSTGTGGGMGMAGASEGTPDAQEAAVLPEASMPDADASMPAPDAGSSPCTGGSIRPGNASVTIQHAGAARDYLIHVPPSYTGKTHVPLYIDMHGSGGNATGQSMATFWNRKADTVGFIVIYPNALNARWNAGTCCSPSMEQMVDDLGFMRAIVEKTTTDGCIDRKRVYAGGLSGGGLMAYRLACMAADMFAAVAPVSGANVTIPCTPSGPVSIVAFRGFNDTTVPYDGGMPLQWYWPAAKADFDQWSQLDRCTGPITTSHGICQTKTQCAGGSDVTLCSVDGGHIPYDAAAAEGAAIPDVAWEIFQRHSLP